MAVNETPTAERMRAVYEGAVDKGRDLYQALNSFVWTNRTPSELHKAIPLIQARSGKFPMTSKSSLGPQVST